MKRSWRITLTAAGLTALWVVGFSMAVKPAAQEQPRMTAPINGKTAGEYFKNVTSTPLKGLPVDDFIGAMGGAQRLGTLKNYVATGESIGFGGFGGVANFAMYGESPNKKATLITFKDFPDRDPSFWAVNGTTGWIQTPRALLQDYELVGGELDGQRFEAQLGFPGTIKTALNNWRIGFRRVIDDKAYLTVQGMGPRGFMATLYFDPDTYLIKRMVRYVPSPAGKVLTQIDFADYRDVNGIKFPFEYNFYWLDGRFTAKIKDIKINQAIPAERFGRLRKVN
jgi:hypothetical protein